MKGGRRNAVLSLGHYSPAIGRLLRKGRLAARRLDLMEGASLRRLFLALVSRAEITKSKLRLYISSYELCRYLAWDGVGLFTRAHAGSAQNEDRVHLIVSQADTICGRRTYILPIDPCPPGTAEPKPWLVDVLKKGAELRTFVLANRERSIGQLAKEKRLGPSQLSRYIRVNYLAPDIQTAIMDGTQPATLTAWSLLYGPLPLDWEQQRQVLGFN